MNTAITPLVMGMDIEEVYMQFGEGLMIPTGGLAPRQYELVERKAQRVRDSMLDLGCGFPLVRRFEAAIAHLHRSGEPFPAGLDLRGFAAMVSATGREISAVMREVRAVSEGPAAVLQIVQADEFQFGFVPIRLGVDQRPIHVP